MQIDIAEGIIAGLAQEQRNVLELAHWRYMAFAGVILDDQFQEQAKADQHTYAHLLKYDAAGQSIVSSDRAADFMAAVTGMPVTGVLHGTSTISSKRTVSQSHRP